MVVIPFTDFASFEEEVPLDKIPFRVSFDYNVRYGFWTMSFANRDNTLIIEGIKLVTRYNLLDQYQALEVPPGELYVIDTTDEIDKIDRENILDPLALVYIGEDEVE